MKGQDPAATRVSRDRSTQDAAARRSQPRAPRPQRSQQRAARPQLTTRQTDVIELTMLGLTNSQIAERLNVSTHAIKFNLASAYRKLAVANRTQAAVAYLNFKEEGRC
jgi:DNA-binding NarL/FixJ family response regulator